MAPNHRQRKSSDTKQRSFHLTDDVYNIVEREASAQGISNSAWISSLIAAPAEQRPVDPERMSENWRKSTETERTALPADAPPTAPQPSKRDTHIILPDPSVSEFSVARGGGAVRGKRLKSDNELSGVEGGAPKRRGRREEIDL